MFQNARIRRMVDTALRDPLGFLEKFPSHEQRGGVASEVWDLAYKYVRSHLERESLLYRTDRQAERECRAQEWMERAEEVLTECRGVFEAIVEDNVPLEHEPGCYVLTEVQIDCAYHALGLLAELDKMPKGR